MTCERSDKNTEQKCRKTVYSGKIFDVEMFDEVMPNGTRSSVEMIAHPGAALIVPLFDGKIALIRQYRPVLGEYIWELPAGKLSPGEKPVDCARRELKEETGLSAGDMRNMGFIYTTPGFTDERIFLFFAECHQKGSSCKDSDEVIELRFFTKKKVRELFLEGEIKDAKTIAGLCLAGILSQGMISPS